MKRIRNAAALSALIALSGASWANEPPSKHIPKEIAKQEYMKRAGERFDKADQNEDGKLDAKERQAMRDKMRHMKKERMERMEEKRKAQ